MLQKKLRKYIPCNSTGINYHFIIQTHANRVLNDSFQKFLRVKRNDVVKQSGPVDDVGCQDGILGIRTC